MVSHLPTSYHLFGVFSGIFRGSPRAVTIGMLRIAAVATLLVACGSATEDAGTSAPSALGEDAHETYRTYADIAADAGSPVTAGTVTVVGLRGVTVDGERHDTTYHHGWDDTFVVLKADGTAVIFAGSTHPFESDAPGVPDVNRDGKRDVGMIRPGIYDVLPRAGLVDGQASYAVTRNGSGALPGWRDTNHDGVLTAEERTAAENRGDAITDVLFHDSEGTAPPAVGCQVFATGTMKSFITAVGGPRARFRYVLVDATRTEP